MPQQETVLLQLPALLKVLKELNDGGRRVEVDLVLSQRGTLPVDLTPYFHATFSTFSCFSRMASCLPGKLPALFPSTFLPRISLELMHACFLGYVGWSILSIADTKLPDLLSEYLLLHELGQVVGLQVPKQGGGEGLMTPEHLTYPALTVSFG